MVFSYLFIYSQLQSFRILLRLVSRPSHTLLLIHLHVVSCSRGGIRRDKKAHMVNTIPPLSTSRANLGSAPDQNVKIPSSLKMRVAHTKLFLYSFRASMDCMLCKVMIVSTFASLALLQLLEQELTEFLSCQGAA